MLIETIVLNRIYRSNEFTRLKVRIDRDKVVFAITDNFKLVHCGGLSRTTKEDTLVDSDELPTVFALDENEKKDAQPDSEESLYKGMELQWAYQSLALSLTKKFINEEECAFA